MKHTIIGPLTNGPAAPKATEAPKFWNIASTGDDTGEILLYGDVMSRQPVDWWTGEPEPGLYITPEGFLEDLEAVKDKSNITIKINSCGGDLYTGIAIHNAIKSLGGHKTVVVEGIAASAASVIMCAGDDVQVYPGSMVMIHGVSALLVDYINLQDLKKLTKDFDASERAIAQIYHAKTGIEVDQLRNMMTRETWMVGQEAVDNGFADTILEDEGPAASLSADKKVMLVAGIRHDVAAFHSIPGIVPINKGIPATTARSNKPTAKAAEKSDKEEKTMNAEELRAQHPDVVAEIEAAAREAGAAEAITNERARLAAIEAIEDTVGDAQLVHEAKYGENPLTAEQLALKAMQNAAKSGAKFLSDHAQDVKASGAEGVEGKPQDPADPEGKGSEQEQVNAAVALFNKTR